MELKVWVEGVARVVCGLSLETSCQEVVIALAQAIGQTGRYVLIQRFRDTERQLVANDCPLQSLALLGQLASEVQFILRRTGPSTSDGPDQPSPERGRALPRYPEPEAPRRRGPNKALTFNLGPSTIPRRTKVNKAWSPRASPMPQSSPTPSLDSLTRSLISPTPSLDSLTRSLISPTPSLDSLTRSLISPTPSLDSECQQSREEVFRQVLQQQERLRDLEAQLNALEREVEVVEWDRPLTPAPGLTPGLVEELDVLEMRLKQNQAELGHGEYWEEQLLAERDLEQDIHRRLDHLYSSLDDHSYRIQDLQVHSARLGQDLQHEAHIQSSQPGTPHPEESLGLLREELHSRLQQGADLDAMLTEAERELQTAEGRMQEKCEEMEELNKDLRQCNLQQFILQTGPPAPSYTDLILHDQTHPLPTATPYLCNAGFQEEDQTDTATSC